MIELVTQQVLAALQRGKETPPELDSTCDAGCEGACTPMDAMTVSKELAQYIDHTLLKPDATTAQIAQLCKEAKQYGFAAVCINPVHVRQAARLLRGTPVKVCSVVGFPLGASRPEIKAMEARRALRDGAREIDMVINIGALKEGNYALVKEDIARVAEACHKVGAVCKVIIEAALLTDDEKVTACRLAQEAKADYVKTSTGFGPGGATEHDVALMRATVGPTMGVKAAGGIRTAEQALSMIRAGATRLGTSASVRILQEAQGLA